jgi:hypothetical protein
MIPAAKALSSSLLDLLLNRVDARLHDYLCSRTFLSNATCCS